MQDLHSRTAETPLFNPVFQLGLELSRQLESGALGLDDIAALVAELECDGLMARAARLGRLIAPVDPDANAARLDALADAPDFASFAARWRQPLAHVVRSHPTFLLSRAQSAAVAAATASGDISTATACTAPHARDAITLDSEHADAMAALGRAQTARDAINARLLSAAARAGRCAAHARPAAAAVRALGRL